jgi:hypothetical protein
MPVVVRLDGNYYNSSSLSNELTNPSFSHLCDKWVHGNELVDALKKHIKFLKKQEQALQAENRRYDYQVTLFTRWGKLWMAEILGEGGEFKLERRFLGDEEREFLSEYRSKTKEVCFNLKNGKIYESYEEAGEEAGRNETRKFWLNNEWYESYKDALLAQQPKPKEEKVTQSEINRRAWLIAKRLAGGSKGSKKFLSQAFKQVWADLTNRGN